MTSTQIAYFVIGIVVGFVVTTIVIWLREGTDD